MILTLIDTTPSARVSAPKGQAAPVDLLTGKPGASFKSSINALINQAGQSPANPVDAPIETLVAKLTQILQSLETLDPNNNPVGQIEAAIEQITSALAEFEAATGIDLVGAIKPMFGAPGGTALGDLVVQPEGEERSADTSGLMALITLITGMTQTNEGTAEAADNLEQTRRRPQFVLERSFGEQTRPVLPAGTQVSTTENASENVRTSPQPAALALAGLSARVEEVTATAQAAVQTKAATRITASGDAKPSNAVEVQIAMALTQNGTDKGWKVGELFKSTFEFVSNVANGQLSLQSPGLGLLPIIESRFADYLPPERPLWSPPGQTISANAPSGGSEAAATKTSRFAASIVDQIRTANVSEGQTRIELSPRGLGNIEIEVTTDVDGATSVVIRADNNVVLNALREMREPWAQIPSMEQGSSFSFEDMSSQQDGSAGDSSNNAGDDTGPTTFDTSQPIDPTDTVIIDGDQLDLMT